MPVFGVGLTCLTSVLFRLSFDICCDLTRPILYNNVLRLQCHIVHVPLSKTNSSISTLRLRLQLWKHLTCVFDNHTVALQLLDYSTTTRGGRSINKRPGGHALYEAPAWPAYQLPPHSGSSVCPQAGTAAQLCISTMISSISAADKAGWALIELKLEFDQLTIPIPFTAP